MKKKILCIDDIKSNLFTLSSVIESFKGETYDVITSLSASEGLTILLKKRVDLILLDVMMPEINGFEAAKMIKSNKKTKDIPIIFVTANKDDVTIEECYKSGGNDYINKPFSHVELLSRISFHLKLREKEQELKDREEELQHEANFDSLTQVYNRNIFHRLMSRKILDSVNDNKSFIFIMVDIDFFKKINDNYGHLVGDHILISMAKLIKSHIRENDLFARWGGEEFVLSFDVDMQKGIEIANNLRTYIDAYAFDVVGNVTCSFGITEFESSDSVDSIIKRADTALYNAKKSGRNRVC